MGRVNAKGFRVLGCGDVGQVAGQRLDAGRVERLGWVWTRLG